MTAVIADPHERVVHHVARPSVGMMLGDEGPPLPAAHGRRNSAHLEAVVISEDLATFYLQAP